MTPARRRPVTPASQGPTRTAPDVPAVADPPADELVTAPVPPAATEEGTELLGPDGEPIAEEPPTGEARVDWTPPPPPETGQVDAEERATTQPRRRPLAEYPLPVWPD